MNSKSIFIVFIFTIIIVCYLYFRSPFNYPYFDYHFDVSRKRKPKIADLLDKYMIQYGFDRFQQHYNYVEAWKEQCLHRISKSIFKKLRKRQFEACIDDKNMFHPGNLLLFFSSESITATIHRCSHRKSAAAGKASPV